MVITPEIFGAGARRQVNGPVVVAGSGVVAPAIARKNIALVAESGAPAVHSSQPFDKRQAAHGGHAVAFAAFDPDSGSTNSALDKDRSDSHQALGTLGASWKLLNKKNVDLRLRFAAAIEHAVLTTGTRKRRFLSCHGFARWCWRDFKRDPSRT
jgi:hypothetical protein